VAAGRPNVKGGAASTTVKKNEAIPPDDVARELGGDERHAGERLELEG